MGGDKGVPRERADRNQVEGVLRLVRDRSVVAMKIGERAGVINGDLFDAADKDRVVASVVFGVYATLQAGRHALEDGKAFDARCELGIGEFVGQRRRKMLRQLALTFVQHVDDECT